GAVPPAPDAPSSCERWPSVWCSSVLEHVRQLLHRDCRPRSIHRADDGRSALVVEAYRDDVIQHLPDRLDVRDENDLLEPVTEVAQQIHHGGTMHLIQRAEDLVENEQGERLPRALRDHLRDGESEYEAREVLLTARDDRLHRTILQYDDVVAIIEFEFAVAPIREIGEERAGQLGDFRAELEVQVGPEIGVGAIELIVQALARVELAEQALSRFQLLSGLLGTIERTTRADGIAFRRGGGQFGRTQLLRRAIVIGPQRQEVRFGYRHGIATFAQLTQSLGQREHAAAHVLALARHGGLTLDLRAQPRGPGVNGHEPVQLAAQRLVSLGIVAGRQRIELAAQRHVARFLLDDLAAELREFLHRELHLHQPALERGDFLYERAAALIELLDIVRHLVELLHPPLEVIAIHANGLQLAVQQFEHGAQRTGERTCAGGTSAVLAGGGEPVALLLQLGELVAERLPLGFRFLPVAHPLGAACLELSIHQLQLLPFLALRERDLLLQSRRALDARTTITQTRQLLIQCLARREQRTTTTLLARQRFQVLEFGVIASVRLQVGAQRLALGARRGDFRQVALQPLRVAAERGLLAFCHPQFREHRLQLVALPLHGLPAWRHALHRRDGPFALGGRGGRDADGRRQPRLRFGELAHDDVGIRHPLAQPRDARHDLGAPAAHQDLRRAQPFVPQDVRQELRALRRPHGRHHAQLLLSGEVRVEELFARHPDAARQEIGDSADGIG